MSQDYNLVSCAALPGLKLLWGCVQTQAGYDDALVVRE
jgi:hypothetical protein